MKSSPAERRRRLTHRALPALGGLAAVSLVAGAFVGGKVNSASENAAADFVAAWQQGDFRAMHELLTADAKETYPPTNAPATSDTAARPPRAGRAR